MIANANRFSNPIYKTRALNPARAKTASAKNAERAKQRLMQVNPPAEYGNDPMNQQARRQDMAAAGMDWQAIRGAGILSPQREAMNNQMRAATDQALAEKAVEDAVNPPEPQQMPQRGLFQSRARRR